MKLPLILARRRPLLAACALFIGVNALALAPQVQAQTAAERKPAAAARAHSEPAATSWSQTLAPAWAQPLAVPEPSSALPSAPVQILLVDRQTRLEHSGTVHYMHFVRQINDAAGLQKGSQIEIDFDPSYEKLSLHQLDILRGKQRISKLDRKAVKLLHRETQLERQMIDGRMTASIVLEGLRVGDRIEWAASLTGDNPVFKGKFVDIEWTKGQLGPTAQWQLRLSTPADRTIHHHVGDAAVEVSEQSEGAWRDTFFRRSNAPQFHYDDQVPSSVYLQDLIEISEYADWAEVSAWASQLFAGAMRNSPAVEAKAAEIEARSAAPADKLRAALDFVQQDVRYFATEIGANSHQPLDGESVLRQRFGDCKDKAALLSTLLKRLGFEATPVLVSASYREHVKDRLPSPLAFDHAIASVQVDGQTLWLDATRAQQTGAPASRQPVGLGFGLLARAEATALSPLPSPKEALRIETVDTLSFPKLAEEGRLTSVSTYFGEFAEWMRDTRANLPAADFEKMVTGETLRSYPKFVPDGPPQLEPVPELNAVKLTVNYRTGAYWRFPDQRLLVGDFGLVNLLSVLRLPDQSPRTQPLRLGLPGLYRHTVRFEFGEDSFAQPSSSRFDERNAQFELHMRYESQRRAQIIEGELHQTAEQVSPSDWPKYRDLLFKIWPRLSNSVSVAAFTPAQAEALRASLGQLGDAMRKGSVPVFTREQANARTRVLALEGQLAAQRLPPKLRAEAELAYGTQLDHLGRPTDALAAFQRAQALDPETADLDEAMAVNAFLRAAPLEVESHVARALQLAPTNTAPRYTRAWSRYFAGDYSASRDEWLSLLQERSEQERSYAAIWLYLSTRRLGGDGVAAVQSFLPKDEKPAWPHPVLQFLLGKIDFKQALAATRDGDQPDAGRECELYLFAAQKALLDGDTTLARSLLRKTLDTHVVEFNEYAMAQRELDRLSAR